jgi:hypothetical protein
MFMLARFSVLTLACAACSSVGTPPPRDAGAPDARVADAGPDAHTGTAAVGGEAGGSGGMGGAAVGGKSAGGAGGAGGSAPSGEHWQPAVGSSWQIQYADALDTSADVMIYDIDLYDTPVEKIDALHAQGRKVICYFDTAYEAWRSDAKKLEPYKGKPLDGWPDQYWLDIREPAVLEVMLTRLDMAKAKHCDAVDPDDVDVRSNNSGFTITAQEQQSFIKRIADAAHERGMGVGLKNDLEEIGVLLDHVDFAVNEECFENDECKLLAPFIRAGKPVFNVEYTDGSLSEKGADICPSAVALKFSTLIKRLNLNAERHACR